MNLTDSAFLCLDIGSSAVHGIAHRIRNARIAKSAMFVAESFDIVNATKSVIDELESHRTFEVNGKRFLIIQCGENSILKTIKGEKYKSGFCLQDRDLKKKFNAIIDSVDVILNPSHNYWPRIYDFLCRLHTFSEKRRYCFYCTQLNLNGNMLANAHLHPEKNSAQRCYHSRRLIAPIYCSDKEEINYLLQAYEI